MKQALISDFIPIIIIFLFLCYTNVSVQFANTILGRFISIALIIYYTSIDYLYGLITCLIIVFFYQSMYIEGLKNMENFANNNENGLFDVSGTVIGNDLLDHKDTFDHPDNAYKNDEQHIEAFVDYPSEYKDLSVYNHINIDHPNTLKDTFVKNNCRNGQLFHKEYLVKQEMTEFVYPNITFENETCNVCDPNCKFSIVEQKLQADDLMKPVDSNDWYNDTMIKLRGISTLFLPTNTANEQLYGTV